MRMFVKSILMAVGLMWGAVYFTVAGLEGHLLLLIPAAGIALIVWTIGKLIVAILVIEVRNPGKILKMLYIVQNFAYMLNRIHGTNQTKFDNLLELLSLPPEVFKKRMENGAATI